MLRSDRLVSIVPLYGKVCKRTLARFTRLKPEKSDKKVRHMTANDLINRLDSQSTDSGIKLASKDRAKLGRGLEQKGKATLSSKDQGYLQAMAEDLLDSFYETLGSSKLCGIFPKVKGTTNVIDFEDVTVTADMAHVFVWWTSPALSDFKKFLKTKDDQVKHNALYSKMSKNINAKLQSCEGVFRSQLIKTNEFRRLPRIIFRPIEDLEKKIKKTQRNQIVQEFLRASSRPNIEISDADDDEDVSIKEEL